MVSGCDALIESANHLRKDPIPETELTVQITAHQWYWSYSYEEYPQIDRIEVHALSEDEAKQKDKPFLLATHTPLIIPSAVPVKVKLTTADVTHSLQIGDFAFKLDALPGITSEGWFEVFEGAEGTYYSQCAELCGLNHYKMPLEIKVVTPAVFDQWIADQIEISDGSDEL